MGRVGAGESSSHLIRLLLADPHHVGQLPSHDRILDAEGVQRARDLQRAISTFSGERSPHMVYKSTGGMRQAHSYESSSNASVGRVTVRSQDREPSMTTIYGHFQE